MQEMLEFMVYGQESNDNHLPISLHDCIVKADSLLKKEKEVIENAWNDGAYGGGQFTTTHDTAEQYYKETFNTNDVK